MESPGRHSDTPLRRPAHYLIIIDSGGATTARLFLDSREPAGEFDAGTEEVTVMVRGLTAESGAQGPEWDQALMGHSADERASAKVFTLSV